MMRLRLSLALFALIAAWIWMHEHPTPLQGVGAVTILAGVTLTHT